MTDPNERAKRQAAAMYPEAAIRTRSINGRPIVLALENNLIRVVRLTDLDKDGSRLRLDRAP